MKKLKAVTLIEVILYTFILTIIISSLIQLAWNIISSGKKSEVQREVFQNGIFIIKKIYDEIKNSKNILSLSTNSICLENFDSNYNPTRIYFQNNKIYIGWGGNCNSLTYNYLLSSSLIKVNNLNFANLSNNNSYNINFTLNISYDNQNQKQEYVKNLIFTSSTEIRSKQ